MAGETLIEFLDEEEDSVTSQLKAFDRSDADRNQLINVRIDSPCVDAYFTNLGTM